MTSASPGRHQPSRGKGTWPSEPRAQFTAENELLSMSYLLPHSGHAAAACVSHAPRKFKSFSEQLRLPVRHSAESRTATRLGG